MSARSELEQLHTTPAGYYYCPADWWLTEDGQRMLVALMREENDTLLSFADAADRAFGERGAGAIMKIRRMIESGYLTHYRVPDSNPRHTSRISANELRIAIGAKR